VRPTHGNRSFLILSWSFLDPYDPFGPSLALCMVRSPTRVLPSIAGGCWPRATLGWGAAAGRFDISQNLFREEEDGTRHDRRRRRRRRRKEPVTCGGRRSKPGGGGNPPPWRGEKERGEEKEVNPRRERATMKHHCWRKRGVGRREQATTSRRKRKEPWTRRAREEHQATNERANRRLSSPQT
jgi:hypothetical protein